MANITIGLATPTKENSAIVFQISNGRKNNFRLSANIFVKTKHFSKANRRVTSANPDAVSINAFLQARKTLITSIFLDLKLKNIPTTPQTIKDALNIIETTSKTNAIAETKPTIWELWVLFMTAKNSVFGTTYTKKYNALQKHLQAFEQIKTNSFLELDSINADTFAKLEKYFYKVEFNVQTTGKYLTMFKSFLKWCVSSKHTQNNDYVHFSISSQADTLKVVITALELQLIRNIDLATKQYLENVKKLFLLSCLTGLRFSDYTRISKDHLKYDNDNNPMLLIRQKKTQTYVEIPLTFESENLVKELISKEIHTISNQKMNEYVKELCQIAGINETFEVHTTAGNKKQVVSYPKYELVSSHTGRRTFATNLLSSGLSAIIVMKYTGHTDYKSFMKYVNIPKSVENDLVRNALNSLSKPIMKIA